MKSLIVSLEAIASVVDKESDLSKVESAIKTARGLAATAITVVQKNGQAQGLPLQELDTVLSTWQSKLSAIMSEPVGREGMAKHARFWAEKLRTVNA